MSEKLETIDHEYTEEQKEQAFSRAEKLFNLLVIGSNNDPQIAMNMLISIIINAVNHFGEDNKQIQLIDYLAVCTKDTFNNTTN